MKWEYKMLPLEPGRTPSEKPVIKDAPPSRNAGLKIEDALNELGSEEWELVEIVPRIAGPYRGWSAAIFKRPAKQP